MTPCWCLVREKKKTTTDNDENVKSNYTDAYGCNGTCCVNGVGYFSVCYYFIICIFTRRARETFFGVSPAPHTAWRIGGKLQNRIAFKMLVMSHKTFCNSKSISHDTLKKYKSKLFRLENERKTIFKVTIILINWFPKGFQ